MTTSVITTNYIIQPNDDTLLVDARAQPINLYLPGLHLSGKRYEIKDMYGQASTHAIQVIAASGQTIDGLPSFPFSTNRQSIIAHSDSANWFII